MDWKKVAKYFRQQFLLWVSAYNEVADKYMISETAGTGSNSVTFTFKQ